jgi:hypothetical protein
MKLATKVAQMWGRHLYNCTNKSDSFCRSCKRIITSASSFNVATIIKDDNPIGADCKSRDKRLINCCTAVLNFVATQSGF